jgi:hypothetical protein
VHKHTGTVWDRDGVSRPGGAHRSPADGADERVSDRIRRRIGRVGGGHRAVRGPASARLWRGCRGAYRGSEGLRKDIVSRLPQQRITGHRRSPFAGAAGRHGREARAGGTMACTDRSRSSRTGSNRATTCTGCVSCPRLSVNLPLHGGGAECRCAAPLRAHRKRATRATPKPGRSAGSLAAPIDYRPQPAVASSSTSTSWSSAAMSGAGATPRSPTALAVSRRREEADASRKGCAAAGPDAACPPPLPHAEGTRGTESVSCGGRRTATTVSRPSLFSQASALNRVLGCHRDRR